ncbi:MAG TPA: energy transducer TonB [Vicinamibacterales bacterium]|jgi:TonB family protein|nr:energy transducer TonB [Vicinamibacterales bacterium]
MAKHTTHAAVVVGLLAMGAGASRSRPLSAAEQEAGRQVTYKAAPVYPELAKKLRLAGTVKLDALVTADGRVKSIEVIGGHPLLVTAAEDAGKRWRYAAAQKETHERIVFIFTAPE